MARYINYNASAKSEQRVADMKAEIKRRRFPMPHVFSTVWGTHRVACPDCPIEMSPAMYICHYVAKHDPNNMRRKQPHPDLQNDEYVPQTSFSDAWEFGSQESWTERAKLSRKRIIESYTNGGKI